MNTGEWITDRLPTGAEITNEGDVWVYDIDTDEYLIRNYEEIKEGQPWMEIPPPPSYVKPKRFTVHFLDMNRWAIQDQIGIRTILYHLDADTDAYREAAEEIAAIYERVMPW